MAQATKTKRRVKISQLEQRVEQVTMEVDRVTQRQKRQSRVVDNISRDLETIRKNLKEENHSIDLFLSGSDTTDATSSSLSKSRTALDDEIDLFYAETKEPEQTTAEKLETLSRQSVSSENDRSLDEKRRQFAEFSARIREQKQRLEEDSTKMEEEKQKLVSAKSKLELVKDKLRRKREERERLRGEQRARNESTSSPTAGSIHSSITDKSFVDEIAEVLDSIHDATAALDAEVVSFTSQDFGPFLPLIGRTTQQESTVTTIDDEINLIRNVTDAI